MIMNRFALGVHLVAENRLA